MEKEIEKYMFNETPFKWSIALTELIKGMNGHAQVFETTKGYVVQMNYLMPKQAEKTIVAWFKQLERLSED